MNDQEVLDKFFAFIEEIDIPILEKNLDNNFFINSLIIKKGAILMDRKRMKHPGDGNKITTILLPYGSFINFKMKKLYWTSLFSMNGNLSQ